MEGLGLAKGEPPGGGLVGTVLVGTVCLPSLGCCARRAATPPPPPYRPFCSPVRR